MREARLLEDEIRTGSERLGVHWFVPGRDGDVFSDADRAWVVPDGRTDVV